jgi:hypothetical protein
MADAPTPRDLVGVDEVCALLEVTPDRVQVMVEEGLLDPVEGSGEGDGKLRFERGAVIAVRELGG